MNQKQQTAEFMKAALNFGRELGSSVQLCLPRNIIAGSIGDRLGSSVGSSMEFQDYRDYQPGDDLRRLDWAAYARSDRLTLRLYREEVQPRVDIICDTSISMTAPSNNKMMSSITAVGVLAESSFKTGASVSCWGFGDGWQRVFNAVNVFPENVLPVISGGFNLGDELARQVPRFAKRGIRICISDFLWQTPPEGIVKKLVDGASAVFLINVLSEEELNPPMYGPSTLIDAESGGKLDLSISVSERKGYLKRLENHLTMWHDAAISHGCCFCSLKAEDIQEGNLSALVSAGIIEYS